MTTVGTPLARAFVRLEINAHDAESQVQSSVRRAGESGSREAEQQGRSISSSFKRGMEFAAGFTGVEIGLKTLHAAVSTGINELKDYQAGYAQLQAGLKSTGGVAGITADQMETLAGKIQNYSGQTDDSIVKTEQLLLTFTNIRDVAGKNNDVFTQTTKIAADMAARMGGDASGAAIQLGKALNDPVKGLTALTRVGVSFTQQQKDQITAMIKAGDTIGAQKIILAELNKEFGGSAEAYGKTLPGQIDIAKRHFEDFAQRLTSDALPAVTTMGHGVGELGHALAENQQYVIGAGVAFAVWKTFPPLIAATSGGMETLAIRTLYVKDALAGLGGGSALRGLAIAAPAAIGAFYALGQTVNLVEQHLNHASLAAKALQDVSAGTKDITAKVDLTDPSQVNAAELSLIKFRESQINAGLSSGTLHERLDAVAQSMIDLQNRSKVATVNVRDLAVGFGTNADTIKDYARIVGVDLGGNYDKARVKIRDFIQEQVSGTPATRAVAVALKDQGDKAKTAADKINDLVTAMEALAGQNQSLLGDQLAVNKAILSLNDNLDANSRTLDTNTLAGITNVGALNDAAGAILRYAEEQTKAGVATPKVNAQVYLQGQALERAAVKAGLNKDQVDKLLQSLLKLPPNKATNVTTPGAVTSKAQVDGVLQKLNALHDAHITVNVTDYASQILADIHHAAADLISLGFTPQGATNTIKASGYGAADGMLVRGPGGPRDDVIPAWLSNGETVVPAHLTPKYAPMFARDGIPGFASGGLVDQFGLSYDATQTVRNMSAAFSGGGDLAAMLSGASGGSVGGGVGRWLPTVLQALALNGASASWAPAVLRQIQFESGGNPDAHQQVIDINTFNGSGGAQGLMQVLYSTFMSNHVPGTSLNIFDPLANLAAGIHHAIFEDPGGLAYLGQGHGYDTGGPWPSGTVGWNTSGRTEHVLTGGQMDGMLSLLSDQNALLRQQNKILVAIPGALVGGLNTTARGARLDARTRTY